MIDWVDLRRLHVLRLVHQYGTVTAAAAALHLTPSAVSHQIRQLSRETGVTLIEPDGRRIRLTPAGHTLIGHADALQARWEQARADLAAHTDGGAGLLRLCGFPTAVSGLLTPAAEKLKTTAPRLAVHIAEVETAEGFDRVLAGDADIALVVPTPEAPSVGDTRFDQRPLLEEPLDLLISSDHPLNERDRVALTDLAHEAWILAGPGTSDYHQLVLVACAAAGFTPHIAHHAKEWVSVSALVAGGLGVALIPRLAALPSHHSVTRIPLKDPPTRRVLTCVRRGSHHQPAIAKGLQTLRDISTQLPPPLLPPSNEPAAHHERQQTPHRHGRIASGPTQ